MKKLVQSALTVAAVGLLVGFGVIEFSLNHGRADLPVGRDSAATRTCQDQLAAKSTELFLNQLTACAVH